MTQSSEPGASPAAEAAVAVVIPCHRVREQVLGVVAAVGPEVARIYVVDDGCPEGSGKLVEERCTDRRVEVIYHERNQGVGAATISGYRRAVEDGASVVVKLDGDGQMDPALIPRFVRPILAGEADYTKGNRFYTPEGVRQMPALRLQGNAVLSFLSKLATGYWDLFDPTNGFTAIHARVVEVLPLWKISRGYFFESDLLFRLNTLRAVVVEIPMQATYGTERSGLKIHRVIGPFLFKNLANLGKRVLYNYFIRSFNIASVNLVLGGALLVFGVVHGTYNWYLSWLTGEVASAGTVMLSSLPIIIGMQLALSFLTYDMQSLPRVVLHRRL